MPLRKTEAIVLRRVQVRDSSLFLVCLTPDLGKVTLAARAARRPGSATAEALQYFAVAAIDFYQREKRGTDYVSRAEAKEHFSYISSEEKRYGHAFAGLEFVNLFLPEDEQNRDVYYLLKRYLRLLNEPRTTQLTRELLHFWLLLCILAGYAPQTGSCAVCGGEVNGERLMFSPELGGVVCANCIHADQLLQKVDLGTLKVVGTLSETDIDAKNKIELSRSQMRQLHDLLVAITEYHVGRRAELKSFDFLRKLDLFRPDGGKSGKHTG
jgi:DNA repair protein RecO (recombination protein O)